MKNKKIIEIKIRNITAKFKKKRDWSLIQYCINDRYSIKNSMKSLFEKKKNFLNYFSSS